jgi:hypothetical protein
MRPAEIGFLDAIPRLPGKPDSPTLGDGGCGRSTRRRRFSCRMSIFRARPPSMGGAICARR